MAIVAEDWAYLVGSGFRAGILAMRGVSFCGFGCELVLPVPCGFGVI